LTFEREQQGQDRRASSHRDESKQLHGHAQICARIAPPGCPDDDTAHQAKKPALYFADIDRVVVFVVGEQARRHKRVPRAAQELSLGGIPNAIDKYTTNYGPPRRLATTTTPTTTATPSKKPSGPPVSTRRPPLLGSAVPGAAAAANVSALMSSPCLCRASSFCRVEGGTTELHPEARVGPGSKHCTGRSEQLLCRWHSCTPGIFPPATQRSTDAAFSRV